MIDGTLVAIAEGVAGQWATIVSAAHVTGALAVTVHAVLGRRDVPAIVGWVGLAWLAPVVGSLLYLLLGINRIQRRSIRKRGRSLLTLGRYTGEELTNGALPAPLVAGHPGLAGLAALAARVTGRPLTPGNAVVPLPDGDLAYGEMLRAIDGAARSVTLLTYIFDDDRAGQRFVAALQEAQARGVAVRVLVDAVGARYSRPSIITRLHAEGVPAAVFLPTRVPWRFPYANLRNHRKLLVVDGRVGFTGGMNIREGHQPSLAPASPVRCLHFRLEGPVVRDMQQVFADDWFFATGEVLPDDDTWYAPGESCGPVAARGVSDGPDSEMGTMPTVLFGALAAATYRVSLITPYFLPDMRLRAALMVAALRGIRVDIVLPARSNIPLMDWAMEPQLAELIEAGVRVWRSPAPFDHTKLFVIDGSWSLIGSTNWDARSLRLNFEYNIECYDAGLAGQLDGLMDDHLAVAAPVELAALRARPFLVRLRNGVVRLLSPYL
ncbi:MAG: phospholipase D-like domain-containing protein [Gemmatimonas sp.]|uniref:phospholipase D-like domain-containing protein n=1 Tax=Gemmatimonas sp. TaxID=1962908 RepID=UPI00391FAAA5|nr:phospholipase D-like domain-containing protein [Gemmatimonadota bacterium]